MSTLSRRSIAAVAALLISACADSTAPSRALTTGGAAADRHGGTNNQQNQNEAKNQNENEQNDQNKNNQNNNDTTRTRTTIALTAPATGAAIMGGMGSARLEARGTQMKLEIDVEHVPTGTVVNFFVGGTMVGSATANALGEAELELENNVPAIAKGTVVSAQTTTGGTIVSGSF